MLVRNPIKNFLDTSLFYAYILNIEYSKKFYEIRNKAMEVRHNYGVL